MLQTVPSKNYNRTEIATILSSLPREDQKWTLDFLHNMIFVSSKPTNLRKVTLAPELMAFMGMGKSEDTRDWKQQKEEYLDERFGK